MNKNENGPERNGTRVRRVIPIKPANVCQNDIVPWEEEVRGAELLDEMERELRKYVVLPGYAAEALALWALHTHAFHLRDVTAYVGVESPDKRCGKTTLLSALSEVSHRPVAAANISSPAFFRVIQELQPTLIIDEADTFLQSNKELRGILNSGYSRNTAFVVRVASGPTPKLVKYSCWCPKVMAAIGRLPDTLADRCILIRMQRKPPGEKCERLRYLDGEVFRRKCARFVADHEERIREAMPEIPEGVNDRAADIWEPLLALADIAGGVWPEKARRAAVGLTATVAEGTAMESLLLDIYYLASSGMFWGFFIEWDRGLIRRGGKRCRS
jgi:hypothetical protein